MLLSIQVFDQMAGYGGIMFSSTCGTAVNDNAKFCSTCGTVISASSEKTQAAAYGQTVGITSQPGSVQRMVQVPQGVAMQTGYSQIPLENGPSPNKKGSQMKVIFIIILALAIVCGGVFAAFYFIRNSGIQGILYGTYKTYSKESELFVSGNNVLKQLKKSLEGSGKHSISIEGLFDIDILDDSKGRALSAVFSMEDEEDTNGQLFLTEDGLFAGNADTLIKLPSKGLGDEIEKYMGNNDMDTKSVNGLIDSLNSMNLSYSEVKKGKLFGESKSDGAKELVELVETGFSFGRE